MRAVALLPLLAFLGGVAEAHNCKQNVYYCGYNLLNKGNYYETICSTLKSAGKPQDDAHINYALFVCTEKREIFATRLLATWASVMIRGPERVIIASNRRWTCSLMAILPFVGRVWLEPVRL
ncbi:hypothetical protein EJ04DRAFT_513050 [Polyplosphaeria fusca]|uniref:Uncharacterized protein n=1 Tax=Polyplosphaeria fusca TaxID=682080 RepID=A0A9P4QZ17_9PLEO|nr:hypothetical protein EJ04DRAFT_513050 [Polyplosphaeria fusca]